MQFAQISFPYPGTRPSVHTKMYVQTQPGWKGKPDCPVISDTVKPYGAVRPCRCRNKCSARKNPPYRKRPLATHQRCGLRTLRRPTHDPSGTCGPVPMRLFAQPVAVKQTRTRGRQHSRPQRSFQPPLRIRDERRRTIRNRRKRNRMRDAAPPHHGQRRPCRADRAGCLCPRPVRRPARLFHDG